MRLCVLSCMWGKLKLTFWSSILKRRECIFVTMLLLSKEAGIVIARVFRTISLCLSLLPSICAFFNLAKSPFSFTLLVVSFFLFLFSLCFSASLSSVLSLFLFNDLLEL